MRTTTSASTTTVTPKLTASTGTRTLPPGYPHFSTATIEFVGTEGAVLIDDSHRDVVLNTMQKGMVLPLSTMPGEQVGHVYQGPMEAETIHFIEAVALDRPVLVTPEQGGQSKSKKKFAGPSGGRANARKKGGPNGIK